MFGGKIEVAERFGRAGRVLIPGITVDTTDTDALRAYWFENQEERVPVVEKGKWWKDRTGHGFGLSFSAFKKPENVGL